MGHLCIVACDRVPVRGNLQLSLGEGIAITGITSAWEKNRWSRTGDYKHTYLIRILNLIEVRTFIEFSTFCPQILPIYMYERVIITIKTTYIISSVYQKLLKKNRIGRIWDKKLKILSGGTSAPNKHGHMWRHLWRGFINSSTYDGSGGGWLWWWSRPWWEEWRSCHFNSKSSLTCNVQITLFKTYYRFVLDRATLYSMSRRLIFGCCKQSPGGTRNKNLTGNIFHALRVGHEVCLAQYILNNISNRSGKTEIEIWQKNLRFLPQVGAAGCVCERDQGDKCSRL